MPRVYGAYELDDTHIGFRVTFHAAGRPLAYDFGIPSETLLPHHRVDRLPVLQCPGYLFRGRRVTGK